MNRLKRGRKTEGGESSGGGKRGVRPQRISNGRVSHQVIHPLKGLSHEIHWTFDDINGWI
jgi:hypothetical protein